MRLLQAGGDLPGISRFQPAGLGTFPFPDPDFRLFTGVLQLPDRGRQAGSPAVVLPLVGLSTLYFRAGAQLRTGFPWPGLVTLCHK